MNQRLLFILCIVIMLLLPPATRAQSELEITAVPAFDGNYRPGAWLPIIVTLTNSGPALDVELIATQPAANFQHSLQVELPAGASKQEQLYVAMEQASTQVLLTVQQGGSMLASRELAVRPRPDERMLALVADPALDLRLPRRQDLAGLPFVDVPLPPTDLPDRPAGLSSLLLLLLGELPAASLSPAQQNALLGWVHNGGHLFIGGGPSAERTLAALPPALRVAAIGPAVIDLDADALGEYVAADGPASLPGVRLQALQGARPFGSADAPLWVERDFGQGRITQLAFAPGGTALRDWPDAPLFWNRLLQPVRLIPGPFGSSASADLQQEQSLTSALGYLPTQNLPSSGGLFWLLAIYAILIGPGLALLLRRFDRQALSWLLLPSLAILVAGLSFALAFALRTDQRLVSQVGLLERVSADQVRARSFSLMLAPQAMTNTVTTSPAALLRPLRAVGGPFGTIDGVQATLPQQQEQSAVSFAAWSLQGLAAEQQLTLPPLDARIEIDEQGISAVVRNSTEQPLNDVVLAYGTQFVQLGDIAPAAEARAAWPTGDPSPPGASLGSLVFQAELAADRDPGGPPNRAAQQREALLNAAVARAPGTNAPGPFVFAWLDENPLPLDIQAEAAARRSVTLLLDQPQIAAEGTVDLPPGWLRLDPAADNRPICFGNDGQGVVAQPAPLTATLRLPPDLHNVRAERLTLDLASERRWPNSGVTTELYDWQRQRWVDVNYDGPGELRIEPAAAYLERGTVRLRISGAIEPAGCVFIRAGLRATAP